MSRFEELWVILVLARVHARGGRCPWPGVVLRFPGCLGIGLLQAVEVAHGFVVAVADCWVRRRRALSAGRFSVLTAGHLDPVGLLGLVGPAVLVDPVLAGLPLLAWLLTRLLTGLLALALALLHGLAPSAQSAYAAFPLAGRLGRHCPDQVFPLCPCRPPPWALRRSSAISLRDSGDRRLAHHGVGSHAALQSMSACRLHSELALRFVECGLELRGPCWRSVGLRLGHIARGGLHLLFQALQVIRSWLLFPEPFDRRTAAAWGELLQGPAPPRSSCGVYRRRLPAALR